MTPQSEIIFENRIRAGSITFAAKKAWAGSIALLQKSFWTINGLQGKYRHYDYLDLCEAVVLMIAGLETLLFKEPRRKFLCSLGLLVQPITPNLLRKTTSSKIFLIKIKNLVSHKSRGSSTSLRHPFGRCSRARKESFCRQKEEG